jgi:hypothetical protein
VPGKQRLTEHSKRSQTALPTTDGSYIVSFSSLPHRWALGTLADLLLLLLSLLVTGMPSLVCMDASTSII